MYNLLPLVALMSVPRDRRRRLMPLTLPAAAGLPAAQAGALAVVSADRVAKREGNAATAEAATAVTTVLTTAVEKGATLTADDFKNIPLVQRVVAGRPDIFDPVSLGGGISNADLDRMIEALQQARADRAAHPTGNGRAPKKTSITGAASRKAGAASRKAGAKKAAKKA